MVRNFFLIIIAIFLILLTLGPFNVLYATGDSMEPTINQDDLFITHSATDVEEGDIVRFYAPEKGIFVTHRIVEDTEDGYITKGDNNPNTDQSSGFQKVQSNYIHGEVLTVFGTPLTVPRLGAYVPIFIEYRYLLVGILILISILLVLIDSNSARGGRKRSIYYNKDIFTQALTILIIVLVSFVFIQSTAIDYSLIYTNAPDSSSRSNVVQVGSPVSTEVTVDVRQGKFSHTVITTSSQSKYDITNVKIRNSTAVVTIKGPEMNSTGVLRGKINVYNYPAILPYSWTKYIHKHSPLFASFITSMMTVLPVVLTFIILYDPYGIIRDNSRENR